MSSGTDDPIDPDDVTRHVLADPALKAQMYEKGFIQFLAGRYYLTAKGRWEMARRARARVEAQQQGLVGFVGETEQ